MIMGPSRIFGFITVIRLVRGVATTRCTCTARRYRPVMFSPRSCLLTTTCTDYTLPRTISEDPTAACDPTNMTEKQSEDAAPKFTELSVDGWKERWEKRNIGFHKTFVNALLQKYVDQMLHGRENLKILVPLCGKTLDMKWLADKGHSVYGVEGVEQAILEFFKEQELEYTKEPLSDIEGDLYKSADGRIRLYKCDFFDFGLVERGFDAIWDRGSLVAINREDREKYAKVITSVASSDCRMLTTVVLYDETKWPGPPHCVPEEVMRKIYGDEFSVTMLEQIDGWEERWLDRGVSELQEVIYLLTRK